MNTIRSMFWRLRLNGGGVKSRDREFDVFMSYANQDGQFVRKIAARLEGKYKIELHQRNFVPGLTISSNIHNAVRNSNCAVIILTQNYLESEWCQEELTQSILENASDKHYRLIFICMQDVATFNIEGLDPEIGLILKHQPCLDVKDPYLWMKLDILLEPHRSADQAVNHSNEYTFCDETRSISLSWMEDSYYSYIEELYEPLLPSNIEELEPLLPSNIGTINTISIQGPTPRVSSWDHALSQSQRAVHHDDTNSDTGAGDIIPINEQSEGQLDRPYLNEATIVSGEDSYEDIDEDSSLGPMTDSDDQLSDNLSLITNENTFSEEFQMQVEPTGRDHVIRHYKTVSSLQDVIKGKFFLAICLASI